MSTALTLFEIEEEIKKRTRELADLEQQLTLAKLEPRYQLAKTLHSIFCTHNHTDGCGWFYEMKNKQDDWLAHTHGEYLQKALKFTHACQAEGIAADTALKVFKLAKESLK
jgi:hypothetical protein